MDTAIKVENLVKSYGVNTVIKEISFSVNRGEIFALLGVNGAGKTTTLECIEGIRKYDKGNIIVNGKMGVQLQSSSLPAHIRSVEAYQMFSRWNNAVVDREIFNVNGLEQIRDKMYRELSTGQKRRLHLLLALIGNPDIIFLDEPTAGLDVEGRVSLHEQIRKLKDMGKTIIMASHDMAEVESLCDRIAILKDGKIAFNGTTEELSDRMQEGCRILIKTEKPLVDAVSEQGYWVFHCENIGSSLLEILEKCKRQDNTVLDVKVERTTLEQGFMGIAKEGQ